MVDDLRRALELLTVYRPRAADTWSPELVGSAMAYYPLVGAGIGCALWCLYLLLAYVLPAAGRGPPCCWPASAW